MKALIKNITVTERVRKEITKIDELAADIRMNGMINPITVMSVGDGEYRLLAGLRRLRAVERIGLDEIDVNVVSPFDAEMELRIGISENEQREPFTFSENMDYARLVEEIEKAKGKERMSLGGKGGMEQEGVFLGTPLEKGKVRDAVANKIGMSGVSYDRAKYITENAPKEVIEELDKGERKIRPTYDELKAKKASAETVREDNQKKYETEVDAEIGDSDEEKVVETSKPAQKSYERLNTAGLLSKADEEAIQRNKEFEAMPPMAKVKELQRQLKEERVRAVRAESDLANLKDIHRNAVYHKDSIINNLQARLEQAEARIQELETLYCPDEVNEKNQSDEIPYYE